VIPLCRASILIVIFSPRSLGTRKGGDMIVCGKCSKWENGKRKEVRHKTVAAVKACHMKGKKKTSG